MLIKAGATGASARAAQAHTGALVGEDRVFDAVLQEMGVIRVGSVEEMLDVALMLVGTPQEKMPAGPVNSIRVPAVAASRSQLLISPRGMSRTRKESVYSPGAELKE